MRKTTSTEATKKLGQTLAPYLHAGDVVVLSGDLGAGKTQFVQGVAAGLGISDDVVSPTFNIVIEYSSGSVPLYHFDLYRLADPDEFYAAGLDEFVGGDGVAVVEWPQMAELEPRPALKLSIRRGESDDERWIEIENRGVAGFEPQRLREWGRSE